MALYRSVYGLRQEMAPIPFQAGAIITADFTYSFETVGLLAADKLELGVLPSGAKIVDAILIPESLNGNASVGLMSGEAGANDAARTVGADLWSATAVVSTPLRAALLTAFKVAASNVDRGIGYTTSAGIVAGAGKRITLRLLYTMP